MRHDARKKRIERSQLSELREELRSRGETLVHCHGCFDIVHPGHIHHLRFAAQQGDRLIISVTPDRYVNKGPDRPMFEEQLRLDSLAALECVDWVVLNDAPTAVGLINEVQPDVYIKGAEYQRNHDPRFLEERSIVERYNGRVVFSDDDVVFSSSAIIDTIRSAAQVALPEASLSALASRHDLSSFRLTQLLRGAGRKRVLVLSETIMDVYAHCARPEIAQEHPMLSLHPDHEEFFDGGGAVIAKHLAALGLDVTLCTPLGSDQGSRSLWPGSSREGSAFCRSGAISRCPRSCGTSSIKRR
jgi:rfaE bifunctional protein nucleotidyltransferase chain/domain